MMNLLIPQNGLAPSLTPSPRVNRTIQQDPLDKGMATQGNRIQLAVQLWWSYKNLDVSASVRYCKKSWGGAGGIRDGDYAQSR